MFTPFSVFFFSSRRRHTRWTGDWSSDVCSSDLAGFVERGTCESDRRVVYAVLTDAGLAKVREASATHVAQIDELFAARLDSRELARIADLMERLGDAAADDDCR